MHLSPAPSPLTISSFPRAILHIDGDAFFASCEQALDPKLKGKPVITGKERGIAASMSYEAKARGVTRAMRYSEIKQLCPDAIFLPSDYETYSLLSKRLFDIVRRYTSEVEEYGIDECFADITGMRRPLRMPYREIAKKIQETLYQELGFSFSIGLGPTKVIAKIASKYNKPYGLVVMPGREIHEFLQDMPVEKIWGVGPATTALLNKYGIRTALQFARRSEEWVQACLTKPHYEIWHELNGRSVLPLVLAEKEKYISIQKVKTFTPPSSDRSFILAQLSKNIENACIKARRYQQDAREVAVFVRRQDFRHDGAVLRLPRPSALPDEIIDAVEKVFDRFYRPSILYRLTGVTLMKLEEHSITQPDLFGETRRSEKLSQIYRSVDHLSARYGKHSVFLGSSFAAHAFVQHLGDRGDISRRKKDLFRGETSRRRVGVPMFLGTVR